MSTTLLEPIADTLDQARDALREARFRDAERLARQALAETDDEHDTASAGAVLCEAWFRLLEPQQVVAFGDQLLAQFTRLDRRRELFDLLRYVASSCSALGQFARGLAHADRAERLAVQLGGGDAMMMLARSATAGCYANAGNPWQAERLLQSALQLPGAAQLKRETAIVSGNLGGARVQMFHLLRDAGREAAAAELLRAAEQDHLRTLALAQELGERAFGYIAHANLSEVCLQQHRLRDAEAHLECAKLLAREHGASTDWLARIDADIELAKGNLPAAIEIAERMLHEHPEHPHRRFVHATLRTAYQRQGDLARALAHAEAAHGLDTQRLTTHLRAHSEYLVTRLEMEEAQRRAEGAEIESKAQRALAGALELRVQERTAELRAANTALMAEVAERERAERVLRAAQDELVQAGRLALLGQMSAAITHEINQPLTALRALSDNCARLLRNGRTQDVERNLRAIGEMTDRMGRITAQLKSFAHKAPPPEQSVRLVGTINDALMLMRGRAQNEGVAVEIAVPPALRVRCDGYRLEQVMRNLMTNAIDAMRDAPVKRLTVSAEPLAERVRVRVSDSGCGLSDAVLHRLFEPFFSTKPPGEGLGLGLVISSGIVREFGSTLRASNLPGGAAFEFELKLDGEVAAPA